MTIISLGWGVQSFALAAMSALKVLPKVDVAIHADTTHERTPTREFAERWTPWLEERGIRVITVTPKRATGSDVANWGGVFIPAYTQESKLRKKGLLRRQCTREWKIEPSRRWIRKNIKKGEMVEQWLGITYDEVLRVKPSDVKYVKNRWPFLEPEMWRESDIDKITNVQYDSFGGYVLTRGNVVDWLLSQGLEVPQKSACTFCPYHSNREWTNIKTYPSDWQEAVKVDQEIRGLRPGLQSYIHHSRTELAQVQLEVIVDNGDQFNNECEGVCGI